MSAPVMRARELPLAPAARSLVRTVGLVVPAPLLILKTVRMLIG